jgi:hypothetical protein
LFGAWQRGLVDELPAAAICDEENQKNGMLRRWVYVDAECHEETSLKPNRLTRRIVQKPEGGANVIFAKRSNLGHPA